MKIILERNLDFKQFQNLIILIFCCVIILFGMLNSLPFSSYISIKLVLLFLIVLFFTMLFTKNGFFIKNNEFYTAVFLFGFVLKKNVLQTFMYDKLTVIKGRLSTNYNYSHDIREFRNWEPDLNVSVNSFSIIMINENDNLRKKILRLTKPEKVKTAINFIVENTNLNF